MGIRFASLQYYINNTKKTFAVSIILHIKHNRKGNFNKVFTNCQIFLSSFIIYPKIRKLIQNYVFEAFVFFRGYFCENFRIERS